jgi:two-component system chemotaxis response regulator CheY
VTASPATVLVVEDDEATRDVLIAILEEDGYHAVGAANGAQALAVCEKEPPNLILLDLMMPVMDGWQFLAAWADRRPKIRCPIVLLSGLSFVRDAPGVADFLSKPVEIPKLQSCLRRLLR